MKNKTTIILTTCFLLVSFTFLSLVERRVSNINNQDIWMLYFDNPQSQSIDFKIENHSKSNSFHWKISINKSNVKEGDMTISSGETKTVPISISDIDTAGKKITVTVTSEKNMKEIYKNF